MNRTTYCNCKNMYLDYVNNFLTVEAFAKYYSLTIDEANEVIDIGRIKNNNNI